MQSFIAAVVQLRSVPDKPANLAEASRLVTEAAAAGAQLVALPEVFAWRGPHDRERAEAETVPGPITEEMGALAKRLGIHLVAGSILERAADEARPFNTTTLLGPDGRLLGAYRKIHLFDIDLPGRVSIRESALRAAGKRPVCVKTQLGCIGLAICYDLRFPELFRALGEQGAEVVVMPSAFTRATGQAHWETLLRARAIENQCFVMAPDQFGAAASGFEDYGNSLIVDPWGKVLARGTDDRTEVLSAHLDADLLARVRRELPCLEHRRL